MAVYRLPPIASWQEGLPCGFQSMRQQVYVCFAEERQKEQSHLQLPRPLRYPDTQHEYEAGDDARYP